jgi:hypothetical protein
VIWALVVTAVEKHEELDALSNHPRQNLIHLPDEPAGVWLPCAIANLE